MNTVGIGLRAQDVMLNLISEYLNLSGKVKNLILTVTLYVYIYQT